jgi:hypothetical protein
MGRVSTLQHHPATSLLHTQCPHPKVLSPCAVAGAFQLWKRCGGAWAAQKAQAPLLQATAQCTLQQEVAYYRAAHRAATSCGPPFWCTAPFSMGFAGPLFRALPAAFSAGTFPASGSAAPCTCRKCSACRAAMHPVRAHTKGVSICTHGSLFRLTALLYPIQQELHTLAWHLVRQKCHLGLPRGSRTIHSLTDAVIWLQSGTLCRA